MSDTLLACRDCGQLHRAPGSVLAGKGLACVRCGSNLLLYPWSMLDVYLLGTYVAYTRLAEAVETNVATGGYALGALVLVQALLVLALGRRRVWDLIADPRPVAPRPGEPWVACEICQLVLAAPATEAPHP